MKEQTNPWLNIPLEDYERHMSHHLVGQVLLLNSLTKKYLDEIKPETAVFLGIAGGNGLEHIDNNITRTVLALISIRNILMQLLKDINIQSHLCNY